MKKRSFYGNVAFFSILFFIAIFFKSKFKKINKLKTNVDMIIIV